MPDYFNYKISISVAKQLLKKGIITDEEYKSIDTMLCKKYSLSLSSIFRETQPEQLDN